MALLVPGTKWDPLGKQTENGMTAHDVLCFHTMVGPFGVVHDMFHDNGYGGTESHLGVRHDGYTEQWQDLWFQADANLDGNPFVISIETEDMGPAFPPWSGSDVPPWTPDQVEKLITIGATICSKEYHKNCPSSWSCHKHGIPAELIPDTKPGRRGIGYHRQGIDGNYPDGRVPGGVKYSKADGKVCPGNKRIAQLKQIIIPGIREKLTGGLFMALTDREERDILGKVRDIDTRSVAMYKALRGDEDADPGLVRGIRNHVRAVIDEESVQDGSAIRRAMLETSKNALTQYGTAKEPTNTPTP